MPGTAVEEPAKTIPIDLDGHESWISVTGVEFENGTVFAFRSLSSERAVDELRDEFVTVVSHELKTPLAAIYGAAETLRSRKHVLDERQREPLLDMIATESDRLARIVNDILLAGQLDSGRFAISTDPVDPLEIARDAIQALRIHARGAEVRLVAQPSLPPARADGRQTAPGARQPARECGQVLLGEAEFELRHRGRRYGHVRFAIQDQGLGIPGDELRRIFREVLIGAIRIDRWRWRHRSRASTSAVSSCAAWVPDCGVLQLGHGSTLHRRLGRRQVAE